VERKMKIKKILMILTLFFIFNLAICAQGQETCDPDPSSPGGDHADDNFSFSTFIENYNPTASNYITAECVIPERGYYKEAISMLDNIGKKWATLENKDSVLDSNTPLSVLLIPSGALFGKRNDTTFKYALENYVRQGGTILCFAQQDSYDYTVIPVPEGDNLQAQGWRNVQKVVYMKIRNGDFFCCS
jgi:hypothetical protein